MSSFNPITFAKGVLRKASYKVPKHYEALKKASTYYSKINKDGSKSKRKSVKFKCAKCKKFFNRKEVQVDHVEPIGIFRDIERWIIALIEGERQVLCEKCHKEKTLKDKKMMKELKNEEEESS